MTSSTTVTDESGAIACGTVAGREPSLAARLGPAGDHQLSQAKHDRDFIRRCRAIDRLAGIVWADELNSREAALPNKRAASNQ